MTDKIKKGRALICNAVQIKNKRQIGPLSANHNEVVFSLEEYT